MKNNLLLLAIMGVVLSSCATTNRYASSSFEDAIYYSPNRSATVVVNTSLDNELEALRGKTRESNSVIIDGRVIEGIYANEDGVVNIYPDEDKTYLILNPGESFEDRLRKFDSPTYEINISYNSFALWNTYNPWAWDIYFNPRARFYSQFNRWYWYSYWSPYRWDPIFSPWYSPWYSPWHYSYHTPFWPYYGHYYPYYGHYDYYSPWYYSHNHHWGHSWYAPGYPSRGTNQRDVYVGRRESGASAGAYERRDARTTQIRGESSVISSEDLTARYSQNGIYRREANSSNIAAEREQSTSRQSTGYVRESATTARQSSGATSTARESRTTATRQSTGVVRQSTGSSREQSTSAVRQSSASTVRESSGTSRQSTQYRQPAATQRTNNSSIQRSTTQSRENSSYRSTAPTRSNSSSSSYSAPPSRSSTTTTSGSTSGRSSGSSSTSSSRSGGRR